MVVKELSQRELRNNSAEVIRGLLRGESYRLTNRGKPVGAVVPLAATPYEDLLVRPGTQVMVFPEGVRRAESTAAALDELRERMATATVTAGLVVLGS